MSKANLEKFKLKCKNYLTTIDLYRLRAYGRHIGVERPAAKDKEALIDDIVAILAFELAPIERSNRGAPVKNDTVDPRIPEKIAEFKAECFANDVMMDLPEFDFRKEYKKMQEERGEGLYLVVNDPAIEEVGTVSKVSSWGQVSYMDDEWVLLPLNGAFPEKKVPIPISVIEKNKLREGDVINCNYREKGDLQTVEVVVSINGVGAQFFKERPHFDECNACYSKDKIEVFKEGRFDSIFSKTIDWIFPITCGQRGCIISAPKAGKTRLLRALARTVNILNPHEEILVLLTDQTHETVSEFRRLFGDRGLVYTTYEDDADRQIYVAEWILKRAKRYAEMGRNVVLFVDSLSALARAFNDTEASMGGKTLPCGLEVKTIHYLKKYFGTARCLEEGGSITIIGSLSVDTGNPMDDIVARELSDIATVKFELSEELALRRVYPAVNFEKSQGVYNEEIKDSDGMETEILLRNKVLPSIGSEGLLTILDETSTKKEFDEKIKALANSN